jgi:hypothetical protein
MAFTAAAMCAKEGVAPRDLDGVRVRQAMIEQGVPLEKAPGGAWEKPREMPGTIEPAGAGYTALLGAAAFLPCRA